MSNPSARLLLPLWALALLGPVIVPAQQTFESSGVGFRIEVLLTDLKQPSALVFLPGGDALLVQRQRGISLFKPATRELVLLEGAPEALTGSTSGVHDPRRPAALGGEDAGVHDVILHPEYEENGWIYISYSEGERERSTTVVDRFRLQGTALIDRQRIFTANAWSEDRFHYGGRMAFFAGHMFLTIGDRHHQDRAQELSTHCGKILRLRDDGTAPPDNPFAGTKDALPEIWSYGHRNPQGLVADAASGRLWAHEHGPQHGDEFNLITRGGNYGWPIISYGWQYAGGPVGMGITRQNGMEQPLWVWSKTLAPSGIFIYSGDKFPAWRGSFFSGAMASGHLNRLVVRDGTVVLEERLLLGQVRRVRLVAQDPQGFIYLGTDTGQLLRLSPEAE